MPLIVGPTLVASAYAVADLYATVSGEDWDRTGVRSDGSVFTIATLGRYHLHDVFHHLHDVSALANRVTVASYDAYADDYAAGTCVMPDSVAANVARFVAGLAPGSRVLEIGSGPGRDALALEQIGMNVRRTDITPAFVRQLNSAGFTADVVDPLRDDLTDPLRDGTPYDAVWANASLLHVRRDSLPVVLRRLAAVTRAGGSLHLTLKEGDGERWSVHGHVAAPRFFTYWREDALREVLLEEGWDVDEVRSGDERDRGETWLAVFATRR